MSPTICPPHFNKNPRSGFIEYVEIMDAEKGLLKFIRDTFLRAEAEKPVPDLRKDRDGWYRWNDCWMGVVSFAKSGLLWLPFGTQRLMVDVHIKHGDSTFLSVFPSSCLFSGWYDKLCTQFTFRHF